MLLLFVVLLPLLLATAVFGLAAEGQGTGPTPDQLALAGVSLPGVLGVFLWFRLPPESASYLRGYWVRMNFTWIPEPVRARFALGADALGLSFFLLSVLLLGLVVLFSFREKLRCPRLYYAALLGLAAALFGLFMARDLLLFYFFWELLLPPAYLLVGLREELPGKPVARHFLTGGLLASLLLLAGVSLICYTVSPGATAGGPGSFPKLYGMDSVPVVNTWISLSLLGAFGLITAIFPLHLWQLEDWKEAPTAGSIFLTGLFVNTGIYGFVRVALPVAYSSLQSWAWWLSLVVLFQVIYGALVAWAQADSKGLVAYTGFCQLGFGLLGIFTLKAGGIVGGLFQVISHGLIITGLFLIIRIVSRRSEDGSLDSFSGLADEAPALAVILAVFLFASLGLAGTSGFFGKLVVISNLFTRPLLVGGALLGFFLAVPYVVKFLHQVVFAPSENNLFVDQGVEKLELGVLLPLVLLIFGLGFYPNLLFRPLRPVVQKILNRSREVQKVPKSVPARIGFKQTYLENLVWPESLSGSAMDREFSSQGSGKEEIP